MAPLTEHQALRRMIDERGVAAKLDLLLRASRDARLVGRTFQVYAALVGELDLEAFHEVKHTALAKHVKAHKTQVGRCIKTLTVLGYVERDAALDGRLSRYRLNTTRPAQTRPAA